MAGNGRAVIESNVGDILARHDAYDDVVRPSHPIRAERGL